LKISDQTVKEYITISAKCGETLTVIRQKELTER